MQVYSWGRKLVSAKGFPRNQDSGGTERCGLGQRTVVVLKPWSSSAAQLSSEFLLAWCRVRDFPDHFSLQLELTAQAAQPKAELDACPLMSTEDGSGLLHLQK